MQSLTLNHNSDRTFKSNLYEKRVKYNVTSELTLHPILWELEDTILTLIPSIDKLRLMYIIETYGCIKNTNNTNTSLVESTTLFTVFKTNNNNLVLVQILKDGKDFKVKEIFKMYNITKKHLKKILEDNKENKNFLATPNYFLEAPTKHRVFFKSSKFFSCTTQNEMTHKEFRLVNISNLKFREGKFSNLACISEFINGKSQLYKLEKIK